MLTLSVMVLVFLVGYCAGGWRMLAKFEKELGAHVAALEALRESVGRHASWMLHEHPEPEVPCPRCGVTAGTFQTKVEGRHQRVCNSCLYATQVFVPLDDGR